VAAVTTASSERALVLVGFMGAGKSRALRAARAAGLEAIDADELLERELGAPIADFFDREGEDEFRRREAALVPRLVERARGGAIALGGGAVLSEAVREAIAGEVVAWLQVGVEDAWERTIRDDRPLARDRDAFVALHSSREPLYRSLADAIIPQGDDIPVRALPHLLALRAMPQGTRLLWGVSKSGEYPAYIGPGLLESSPLGTAAAFGEIGLGGRPFAITDTTVGRLYGKQLGSVAGAVEVPAGETAKTLAQAERILGELARLGARREDHLVALGGGVVGDLAGFCAAVYQRGVPVVQVPTTLVAQVDSAYGGKTGVDLPQAKNYVGAYHFPAAVVADTDTLRTLPEEELAAGFVEVVKTALIAGGGLWERVRELDRLAADSVAGLVAPCAQVKLEIVAADERDAGGRAALNLGHTVGHAIEAASGYARYRHGEAVGLGLLAALRLSGADEVRAEVTDLLARHGLATRLDSAVAVEAVLEAVDRDKKRTARGVGFVLLERPGSIALGRQVDEARVRAAVEELR
jgi:shikimate kinase/3-dehydroquinate synthase